MQTVTGELYNSEALKGLLEARGEKPKDEATVDELTARLQAHGEPIVPVSNRVAQIVEAGHQALNRAERRRLKHKGHI